MKGASGSKSNATGGHGKIMSQHKTMQPVGAKGASGKKCGAAK